MTSNSYWEADKAATEELAKFMDKYLYNRDRFPNADSFSAIERVYDKSLQLSGIDVRFLGTNGHEYYVDEKAQIHYLNKPLPTFSFELLSRQNVGWLCNPELKTHLYMLIWPYATHDDWTKVECDDFEKVDCLLVEKKKVLQLLENNNLSIAQMQQRAQDIRNNGPYGEKIEIPGIADIYYKATAADKLNESPINIIIRKALLETIALRQYTVTRDHVIMK